MGSPVATLRTGAIGNPTGSGAALALPPPTQPAESATRATADRTAPTRRRVSAERRNKVGETVTGGFHPGGAPGALDIPDESVSPLAPRAVWATVLSPCTFSGCR